MDRVSRNSTPFSEKTEKTFSDKRTNDRQRIGSDRLFFIIEVCTCVSWIFCLNIVDQRLRIRNIAFNKILADGRRVKMLLFEMITGVRLENKLWAYKRP